MDNSENARLLREIVGKLDAIQRDIGQIRAEVQDGFGDTHVVLHGLMFKTLAESDITELRSKMKNPPALKDVPFWANVK
jgi:hypothetical protein